MRIKPIPHPKLGPILGPRLRLRWRLGILKAWLWRPLWGVQYLVGGPRIRIGRNFSLQGHLKIKGPGTIILGNEVIVDSVTTLFTHSTQAVIQVGDRSYVNGARMGCFSKIEIGEDGLLGDCRIMDSDFHPIHRRRMRSHEPVSSAPVRVGKNVWLGAGSAVLKGVQIGDHSVIAFGSVVVKSVPDARIFGGNPARDLGPVPE